MKSVKDDVNKSENIIFNLNFLIIFLTVINRNLSLLLWIYGPAVSTVQKSILHVGTCSTSLYCFLHFLAYIPYFDKIKSAYDISFLSVYLLTTSECLNQAIWNLYVYYVI
jgi:hypothetical protein